MADLIERYVHQVGRYVPQKERTEIQAELRSQLQDQLEDRYQGTPTQEEVAAVLAEMGDPRRIAASYGGEQYLIGPMLYPVMMMVLRRGWVLAPPIIVALTVLGSLMSNETINVLGMLIESAVAAVQGTLLFSAIVVLIFAILERSGEDLDVLTGQKKQAFDPLALPEVDDPAAVDRFDATFNVAFNVFWALVLLYFLRAGGLTLRFDLAEPGEVLPAPVPWLVVLLIATVGTIVLYMAALVRNRWTLPTWVASIILELISAVGLYFVLWVPLRARLLTAVPELAGVPMFENGAEIILAATIVVVLAASVGKLVKMLSHRHSAPAYSASTSIRK
jgi:hypothetical protein